MAPAARTRSATALQHVFAPQGHGQQDKKQRHAVLPCAILAVTVQCAAHSKAPMKARPSLCMIGEGAYHGAWRAAG